MSDRVQHFGFLSSVQYNNLTPWYTTLANDEVIYFKDVSGDQKEVNSVTIFSEASGLYIRLLPSTGCIYIPSGSQISIEYQEMESIQVMANAGIKLRWYAQYK